DLDLHAGDGKRCHADERARRTRGAEEFLAHRVDGGAVGDIGQINRHLEDVGEGRAGGVEHALQVAEDLTRLRRDILAADQPSFGVERRHARDEQEIAPADGVGVMADRRIQARHPEFLAHRCLLPRSSHSMQRAMDIANRSTPRWRGRRQGRRTMIEHRFVEANGIRIHVADSGSGPAVVLCHGWPETWYSWRHQIKALAEAGFRVLAPDMRGYGRTSAPEAIEAYTQLHIVGDMVGLLDALGIAEAAIIGHDWGAPAAWHSALMRPDRFRCVAGLSVPYRPRGKISAIDAFKAGGMETIYMMYFQTPGVAERELEADVTKSLRRIYYSGSGSLPPGKAWHAFVPPGKGLLDSTFDTGMPLA